MSAAHLLTDRFDNQKIETFVGVGSAGDAAPSPGRTASRREVVADISPRQVRSQRRGTAPDCDHLRRPHLFLNP